MLDSGFPSCLTSIGTSFPVAKLFPGAFVGYEASPSSVSSILGLILTCGSWLFVCLGSLKSFQSGVAEIIPIRDPRIRESINHHE